MKTLWQNADPLLHTQKLLVLFIFVTMFFAIVTGVLEVQAVNQRANTQAIVRDRQLATIQNCEGGAAILTQFNTLQRNLVRVQRENIAADHSDPKLVLARRKLVKIYVDSILPVPDCSKLPRP